MKYFVTALICIASCVHYTIYAQTPEPAPLLTLDVKNAPLEEVLQAIEKQTGFFFSYESTLLDGLPRISFSAKEESLSYCLKRLFESLPLIYRITGKYIILKRKPRQYTVSGFVRDSTSFESLINATVLEQISGKGVISNSYGFFSITLPAGEVVLRSSYVGYHSTEIRLRLEKDTLIDLLLPPAGVLQEVVVRGSNPYSEIRSSRMGNQQLSAAQLKQIPVLLSEPDLLRALQQQPGIATGTEMFGGMFVRGGDNDGNLFLLDGIPVYNVNHLGGIFSAFNPDAIQHVDFYKGSFSARYGGRLSSVIDVRLKDGDMQRFHGNVSIGLITAKAAFEGPIVKDRTSFSLSFRRTWIDAITTPIFSLINNGNDDEIFSGYSFYDLNAKLNHIISPRSRLYANFYLGQDRLRTTNWYDTQSALSGEELIWRWGNLVSSIKWAYMLRPKLFLNVAASYSRYQSRMRNEWKRNVQASSWNDILSWKNYNEGHFSAVEDWGIRADFDYSPAPAHRIRFGTDYLYHTYRPERKWKELIAADSSGITKEGSELSDHRQYAHEWGIYAEDDWLIGERWKVNAGGRLATCQVDGKLYASFQPRLSVRYLLLNDLSLKASYVKMNQYVHQLSNTYANLPSDIWVPVTTRVRPMSSHQVATGIYYQLQHTYDFSVEGYYKTMNNLIEYKDNASLFPDYVNWDKKISMGSGRSYGMELTARKPHGTISGWVAYTLSWSDRIFDDRTVNQGKRFPFRYDNRHKVNLTATWRISRAFDLSASWVYATGNRVTIPTDKYLSPDSDDFDYVLGRNAAKLADYHRLDLSFNYYRPKKNGRMGIWNVSLYNAYNRHNAFYAWYDKDVIRQRGIIPILPSVSYTYKF